MGKVSACLPQISRVRAVTSRTGAGPDEHDGRVVFSTVAFGLTLLPSPVTKNALVNEGEDVRFVCHTAFDDRLQREQKLPKYTTLPCPFYKRGWAPRRPRRGCRNLPFRPRFDYHQGGLHHFSGAGGALHRGLAGCANLLPAECSSIPGAARTGKSMKIAVWDRT